MYRITLDIKFCAVVAVLMMMRVDACHCHTSILLSTVETALFICEDLENRSLLHLFYSAVRRGLKNHLSIRSRERAEREKDRDNFIIVLRATK